MTSVSNPEALPCLVQPLFHTRTIRVADLSAKRGQTRWMRREKEDAFLLRTFYLGLELGDQVARTAPRIFSTIEDTGNLNPVTIARENYRCRLCHLTLEFQDFVALQAT